MAMEFRAAGAETTQVDRTRLPTELISDIALRAFRSPTSGLATLLSSVAAGLEGHLTAAYLVPAGTGPVELLAAGGRKAAALGPPGRVPTASGDLLRATVAATPEGPCPLDDVAPWSTYPNRRCLSMLLEGEGAVLVAIAGDDEVTRDELYNASSPIGLLTQLIVDSRRIEELRRELHHLREERSLLAAGLQHDLRGPLTSILGCAKTLRQRNGDMDDGVRDGMLESIVSQAERMSKMLTDTLAEESRGPSVPVRRMQTDLKVLGERVAELAASGREGQIVVEATDLQVVTDPDRLERALLNLLDNALKYTPEDVPVHLIIEREPAGVSLTVADNGPGVTPEVLPGLFGAYMTDPSRPDGTGLGLHSVRQLVEQLGGRVDYLRHSGWTRFTVNLPD